MQPLPSSKPWRTPKTRFYTRRCKNPPSGYAKSSSVAQPSRPTTGRQKTPTPILTQHTN